MIVGCKLGQKLNENTVAKTCSAGLFAYYLHALLCCLEERAMLMAASASGCFTAAGRASGIGGTGMHVSSRLTRGNALKFRAARPQTPRIAAAASGRWPSILKAVPSTEAGP